MKKFLQEIYLENKFNDNANELKNSLMLLDLNNPNVNIQNTSDSNSKIFI